MKQTIYLLIAIAVLITACGQQQGNENAGSAVATLDGKTLFMNNCSSCHNMVKDATGPALANVLPRWGNDTAKLMAFIKDPMASINDGGKDSYQGKLYEQWHNIQMPSFKGLSDDDIRSIMRSFNNGEPQGY